MDAVSQVAQLKRLSADTLSADDVRGLLQALGQWGVAEEAGASGDALDEYAGRAQAAFHRLAQAA